jgi:hypothetical protein
MAVSHRTRDSFTTSVEWLHPKMPLLAGRALRSRMTIFGVAGVLSRPERANAMRHEFLPAQAARIEPSSPLKQTKEGIHAGLRRARAIGSIHEQTLSKDVDNSCHFAVSRSGVPSDLTAVCA